MQHPNNIMYAGRGGVKGRCTLFFNVAFAILRRGLGINIFEVLIWLGGREGGHTQKKSTLCTLLIMLTILDDH